MRHGSGLPQNLTAPSMRTPIAGWKTHCHRGNHASKSACSCSNFHSRAWHMMLPMHAAVQMRTLPATYRVLQRCISPDPSHQPSQCRAHEEEVCDQHLPTCARKRNTNAHSRHTAAQHTAGRSHRDCMHWWSTLSSASFSPFAADVLGSCKRG